MQVNQSISINRQRMTRMLVAGLSSTVLLILVISAAHRQGSQGVSQIKLSIEGGSEGGRPVAKAILMLEDKYGWVITYEDPRYLHDSEVTDVTLKVSRNLDKYKPGEAPKVLVPRGGPLEFTYDVSPNTKLPPDPAKVVQKLLDAQAASSNGGRFRLESNGKIMHVIPTMIKNSKGVLVSQESALDTIISLPAQDRSVYDKLESICAAISQVTNIRTSSRVIKSRPFGIGAYPTMFHQYRDQQGAVRQKARDVLVNMFATMESGDDLSWRLLYDPGLQVYLLNIYHVKLINGQFY